jgi:hypothetical protein
MRNRFSRFSNVGSRSTKHPSPLDTLFLHSHSLVSVYIQQNSHELEYLESHPSTSLKTGSCQRTQAAERGSVVASLSGTRIVVVPPSPDGTPENWRHDSPSARRACCGYRGVLIQFARLQPGECACSKVFENWHHGYTARFAGTGDVEVWSKELRSSRASTRHSDHRQ